MFKKTINWKWYKVFTILLLLSVTVFFVYKQLAVNEEEEELYAGIDKQMANWWWARAYPNPYYINDKWMNAWHQAQELKKKKIPSTIQARTTTSGIFGNWTSIGPSATIGGRVLCIAISPANSNNLFVGSASGGIWKSTNAGTSWSSIETGFPVLGVSSLLVTNAGDTIYAGTGEVYRTDTSDIGFNVWKARGTYSVGILRSIDGGVNWSQVFVKSTSNLFGVQSMKFHPSRRDTVFACTTDGLYKSPDQGVTWNKILNKIFVSDLVINPTNPQIMLASVGNLVNSDKGIYRTTDGGTTWVKATSALPTNNSGYIKLRNAGAALVYASIGMNDASENELYMSNDFGTTWVAKSGSHHAQYQFWSAHNLAIDPSNSNKIIIAGVSTYLYTSTSTTTNAGSKGSALSAIHSDVHDIQWDPNNVNTVYICCDGGVCKSTNNGVSFSAINSGLAATQFYASFACSPTSSTTFVGGLQDNGIVKTTDGGTTWNSVAGGDGGSCAFATSTVVYGSNDARTVNKSTNTGGSFSGSLSSWAFVADDRTAFMAPIAVAPSATSTVYCASDNWHCTTNAGSSWTNTAYGTATNYIEMRYKTGIAIGVSYTNASKVYVSTSPFSQKVDNTLNINTPPNLFKSTNATVAIPTFTNIKGTLPNRFVMDFAISKTNDDSVFVVLGGYGSTSHIYVTGNGGSTWVNAGYGLPDVPFNAILIDPVDSQILYAGCDLGVYVSPNRGADWYDYNFGFLDATQVFDLQVTSANKLVAATHGKGILISDLFVQFILPVKLQSFTGVHVNGINKLQWAVGNEINFSHYEVERSYDGNNFTVVDKVNATNAANYYFNDNVKNDINNKFFYRLKMVDKNGAEMHSQVIELRKENSSTESLIQVIGNPFVTHFNVKVMLPQRQKIDLELFDNSGKLVRRKEQWFEAGTTITTFDNTASFASGVYYLRTFIHQKPFSVKLIKL